MHLIILIHFSMHFFPYFFQKKSKSFGDSNSHLAGDDVRDDIQGLGLGRGFEAPRILTKRLKWNVKNRKISDSSWKKISHLTVNH